MGSNETKPDYDYHLEGGQLKVSSCRRGLRGPPEEGASGVLLQKGPSGVLQEGTQGSSWCKSLRGPPADEASGVLLQKGPQGSSCRRGLWGPPADEASGVLLQEGPPRGTQNTEPVTRRPWCSKCFERGNLYLGQRETSLRFMDREMFWETFTTYVRPKLEYTVSGLPTWST